MHAASLPSLLLPLADAGDWLTKFPFALSAMHISHITSRLLVLARFVQPSSITSGTCRAIPLVENRKRYCQRTVVLQLL